jgi:poly-gamma-glutamate synthesis protein (capsule biosynthesis protein)
MRLMQPGQDQADSTKSSTTTQTKTNNASTATRPNSIRLIAAGDMLPHDSVNQNAKSGNGYDYRQFFVKVKPFFEQSDIRYCNQEAPSAATLSPSGYPTFNSPVEFAQDLQSVGCNLINLANNHADDRGQPGIDGTLDTWQSLSPLAYTGINRSASDQQKISYFTVKGVKFAYMGYAECSNNRAVSSYGLNLLSDKALVERQVTEARTKADVVIVGTHWCKENVSVENAAQDAWASYFASKGVDIVIGTGPHYLQPVKRLPKAGGGTTLVWFSLGNFLSTQVGIKGLIGGLAVMDIDTSNKRVTKVGFLPTYMSYYWTAQQAADYDLPSRKDLMIYPLDQASSVLPNAVDKTTVAAQTAYVKALMNSYTDVPILTTQSFGR